MCSCALGGRECCTEGLHSTSTIVTTSLTARTPKTFAHFTPPTRTPEASGAALAFAAASPTHPRSPPPARARWFRSAPRSRARRMERSLRHRQVMRTTRAGVCGHPLRPRGFPLGRRQMGRSLGGRRMGCPRARRRRPRGGARRLPMCRDLVLHSPRPVAAGTRWRLPRPRPPRRRRRRRRSTLNTVSPVRRVRLE